MGATEDTRVRGSSSQSACGGGAKVARGCRAESGALLVPQCCQVLSSTKQSKAKQIGRQYGGWQVAVVAVAVRCRSFSPKWVVLVKRKRIKRAMSEA